MIFTKTKISGAYIIDVEPKKDSRGYFARAFCSVEMYKHNIIFIPAQANISHNIRRGTIRGMHYQERTISEPKFIRCIQGVVWDVIIDMRPESSTYLEHVAIELSAENGRAVYMPSMCAHGNQSLTNNTELLYLMGCIHTPGHERGLRYDDPAINIDWPLPVGDINERDSKWPLL